jgi:hypothetical protein
VRDLRRLFHSPASRPHCTIASSCEYPPRLSVSSPCLIRFGPPKLHDISILSIGMKALFTSEAQHHRSSHPRFTRRLMPPHLPPCGVSRLCRFAHGLNNNEHLLLHRAHVVRFFYPFFCLIRVWYLYTPFPSHPPLVSST